MYKIHSTIETQKKRKTFSRKGLKDKLWTYSSLFGNTWQARSSPTPKILNLRHGRA